MAWDNGGVSPEEHFMSESFRDAGYDTAMVGKWHMGHTIEQHTPNARGFDHFYGHFNTDVSYFDHKFAGGHDFQINGKPVDHEGEYATDIHGIEAERYITELRDPNKPYFLYVPFLAPHSPMEAKDEDKNKYGHRLDTPRAPQRTYAAMVDSLDQAIQKLDTYEGGIRVNAVLRWPDVLPAETVNENVISVLDVFPSFSEAAGVTPGYTKDVDGINRWDAITGKGAKDRGDPLVFTSNVPVYNRFQYGVLDGPWKLVQHVDHFILDARMAEHPVGGVYVKIQPHPGWRAPLDYADAVIPADEVTEDLWSGFGPLATQVLQQRYGEKGRIKYD